MSSEPARNEGGQAPDSHWYVRSGNEEPRYEQVISPHQAVCEALARLGPGATVAAVQQQLESLGLHVSAEEIERVRSGTPACPRLETGPGGP